MKIILFITLLFLFSCSGHIRVAPILCKPPKAGWVINEPEYQPDFRIKKRVWTMNDSADDPYEVRIKDILAEKNIDCNKLENLRVKVGQTWKDVLSSLVPFAHRHTITIEGEVEGGLSE